MEDTWLETCKEWYEYGAGIVWGPTPSEVIREAGQRVRLAIRRLNRERVKTKLQESSLVQDLKNSAASARCVNDLKPAAMAISRCRKMQTRIEKMSYQMHGLQMQMLETDVHTNTAEIMQTVVAALAQTNAMTGGGKSVQHTALSYEKQKAMLEMTQETFASMQDDEEEEEDADDMVSQLASEMNIKLTFDLPQAVPHKVQAAEHDNGIEHLMERMNNLRST
jgi:hypothetical protein